MTLRFIGTTSDDGDCPTLYEIPETDEILVRGDRETDPEHLVQLLFREFRHTAWRLETRRGYASDRNSPLWAKFLAGQPANAWRQNVHVQVGQGKRFERAPSACTSPKAPLRCRPPARPGMPPGITRYLRYLQPSSRNE